MSTRANDSTLLASRHAALNRVESLILLSDEWISPHPEKHACVPPYALVGDSNYYYDPQIIYGNHPSLIAAADHPQRRLQQHYADCLEAEIGKFWRQHDQACRLLCEVTLQKDLAHLREAELEKRVVLEREAFEGYQNIVFAFWARMSLIHEISWRDRLHAEMRRLAVADEKRAREVLAARQEASAAPTTLINAFTAALRGVLCERRSQPGPARESSSPLVVNEIPQGQVLRESAGVDNGCLGPSASSPDQPPPPSGKESYPFLKELPGIIRDAVESALRDQRKRDVLAHSAELNTPPVEKPAMLENSSQITNQTRLLDNIQNAYASWAQLSLDLCNEKMEFVVTQTIRQCEQQLEALRRSLDIKMAVKEVEIKYLREEVDRLRAQPPLVQNPQNSAFESSLGAQTRGSYANRSSSMPLEPEKVISKVHISSLPTESILRNTNAAPYIPSTMRRFKKPSKHSIEELRRQAFRLGVKLASDNYSISQTTPPPYSPLFQAIKGDNVNDSREETPSIQQSFSNAPLVVKPFVKTSNKNSKDTRLSPESQYSKRSPSLKGPSERRRARETPQQDPVRGTARKETSPANKSAVNLQKPAPLKVKQLKTILTKSSTSDSDSSSHKDDSGTLSSPLLSSPKRYSKAEEENLCGPDDAIIEKKALKFADLPIKKDKKAKDPRFDTPLERPKLHLLTEMLIQKNQQLRDSQSISEHPPVQSLKILNSRERTMSISSISSEDITLTSISSFREKEKRKRGDNKEAPSKNVEKDRLHSAVVQPSNHYTKKRSSVEKELLPPSSPQQTMKFSSFDEDTDKED